MPRENKSKYAVLGMLSIQPMSGYDIRQAIAGTISNFWSESYGQIYPILKMLEQEKLAIKSIEHQEGKPDRHVYTLTDAGYQALRDWMREPVDFAQQRLEILLKLFFGSQVSIADNIQQVEDYRALHADLLAKYDDLEAGIKGESDAYPDRPFWLMTVSYGRYYAQATMDWCDETLKALRALGAAQENNTE